MGEKVDRTLPVAARRVLIVLALLLAARAALLAWPGESRRATLEQGDRLLLAGKPGEALPLYQQVAAEGDARGLERASRALELQGRDKDASDAALAAAQRIPDDPRVLAHAARLATSVGRLDEARDCVRRLIVMSPSDLEARLLMAKVEIGRGHPAAAEAWLRRGLEINPHHNVFHFELALLAAKREAWDDARQHFADAVGVNPEFDAEATYQRGLCCVRSGDAAAALYAFETATNLNPRMPMPWYMVGLLSRGTNLSESETALQTFLRLQPAGPEADQARALLSEKAKEKSP